MRLIVTLCAIFISSSLLSLKAETSSSKTFEIAPLASFYNGDALRTTTLGVATVNWHINREFWLGVDFYAGRMAVDRTNGLGLQPDNKMYILDGAFYWNVPATLGVDIPADFYTSIGVGYLWLGKAAREWTGFIGGGLNIHLPIEWMWVHFDLKNYFYVLKNTQGSDFNSDMALSLGPSFVF